MISFTDQELELLIPWKANDIRTFIDRGTGERTSILESCVQVSLPMDFVAVQWTLSGISRMLM